MLDSGIERGQSELDRLAQEVLAEPEPSTGQCERDYQPDSPPNFDL